MVKSMASNKYYILEQIRALHYENLGIEENVAAINTHHKVRCLFCH